MLLSDGFSQVGLWLAAACLCWLFCRMLGVVLGKWRMPELRSSIGSRRLGVAILILLLVRIGSLAGSNILDVGQASSLGAWRVLHGLHLYGAASWPGPGGLSIGHPDSYGPFAYYAYIPFVAVFPQAPALLATLLPALCFDALTIAGLYTLGRRLGGRPLGQAFVFVYLLYPFPDLSLMAESNDGLIAALCVWTLVVATDRPVARGLLMALVLLALSPMGPAVQDVREQAAFAAALLIGAQLLLGYWFYSYLTWFYPLLVVAMIRPRSEQEAVRETGDTGPRGS
jgi:hypothetical protein